MNSRRTTLFGLLVLALLALGGTAAQASAVVGVQIGPSGRPTVDLAFFHNDLAPYGRWVSTGAYGDVFVPRVATGWRPYSHGHWVWTDLGWTWVSNEPFGWACDHYGRWAYDAGLGWEWVPGTNWSPAYVSWQSSPDYVGWAPLPPTVAVDAGFEIGPGGFDVAADLAPASYTFVPVNDFLVGDVGAVALPYAQVVTVFPRTQNITRFRTVNGMLFDDGPAFPLIQRAWRRPIPRYQVVNWNAPLARPRFTGNRIAMFRPMVNAPGNVRTAERLAAASRAGNSPVRLAVRQGVRAQMASLGAVRANQRVAVNAARNQVAAQRGIARAQAVQMRNQQQAARVAARNQRVATARAQRVQRQQQARVRQQQIRVQRSQMRATRAQARVQRAQAHVQRLQAARANRVNAVRMQRAQVNAARAQARAQRMQVRAQRVQARSMRPQMQARPMRAPQQMRPARAQQQQMRAARAQARPNQPGGRRRGGPGR